jgi:peptide/nickel transport system permease protein
MAAPSTESATRPSQAGIRLPRKLVIGGLIIVVLVTAAALAPWIVPYRFDEMSLLKRLKPPSADHWFGTDEFGRDVFSRTLMGARLSLLMGIGATLISLLMGVPLGLLAGYRRGWFDEWLMRMMDVLLSFPPIMLGLLILAVTQPALWKAIIAIGIVYVPPMVRITRSVTLDLVHEEFIQAAHVRGDTTRYILFSEILPNAWPPIAVEASLRGAALSFLGMGAQPPSSDWGLMVSEARPFVDSAPWIALAPGLAMCVTVIGVNLLGDGLREMLDPRMRTSRGE